MLDILLNKVLFVTHERFVIFLQWFNAVD